MQSVKFHAVRRGLSGVPSSLLSYCSEGVWPAVGYNQRHAGILQSSYALQVSYVSANNCKVLRQTVPKENSSEAEFFISVMDGMLYAFTFLDVRSSVRYVLCDLISQIHSGRVSWRTNLEDIVRNGLVC